ncbi:D-isomer specific 2-hydroxyacid dehydrogenase [Caballeronia arvi]|uniref:D-isomer specific 2-hydroxyacid dehydrogenase n=1 Tax=Caballeronia arvi TaxID=1777135 RepID=A0A158J498_9BURK|nr:C-terminal binding protein [Caballeronia arvi]SAL63179.1 D-isomer specific 2-hydroxyacid dehydrogenase [Caballeronia arvi]
MKNTVFLTDYAWPNDSVERQVIENAGFRLVTGPADPLSAGEIEGLVREHQPDAIMTCWARVSSEAIAAGPNLRIVARLGVGLDNIAVETATSRNVVVTNVPDYCVEEVSDHAVGFALAWTRGLVHFDREVKAGRWGPSSAKLRRLSTLTCGIIGFGRIARMTARKLAAFKCGIVVHDPYVKEPGEGIELTSLDELFSRSDIVIVHSPLTDSTHHLVSREKLSLMKPGGLLINVSRGGIVDTDAVVQALRSGHLSGAALDVLESEPSVPPELLEQSGAMLTPHVAFSSDASLIELRRRGAEEVVRVLRGEAPQNPCNRTTK